LRGLGASNDLLAEVQFPGDNMGFQGRMRTKFQDFNTDKSVGEIFNCLEVFNYVLIPLISSTSSISSSRSMGEQQKNVLKLCCFLQPKLLVLVS
jgi:hypothetical protein